MFFLLPKTEKKPYTKNIMTAKATINPIKNNFIVGKGRIRTSEDRSQPIYELTPFDHSGTSPLVADAGIEPDVPFVKSFGL